MTVAKSKKKKSVKMDHRASDDKTPISLYDPNRFFDQTPVWSFSCCDFEHEKWGLCTGPECLDQVFRKLKAYEGQTWREILTDTSGRKNNTKNHEIETYKIIKEAQKRLDDINLSQYDTLYSLTITGEVRLWGIMNRGVYSIVWYDPEHEICPCQVRHT